MDVGQGMNTIPKLWVDAFPRLWAPILPTASIRSSDQSRFSSPTLTCFMVRDGSP